MPKVNIHTPAGLDSFDDQLSDGPPVILADMERAQAKSPTTGSRRCIPTCPMPESCSPPSVSSRRTRPAWKVFSPGRRGFKIGSSNLIVENSITDHADFTYWRESDQALQFQRVFQPAVIHMDYRLPDRKRHT